MIAKKSIDAEMKKPDFAGRVIKKYSNFVV